MTLICGEPRLPYDRVRLSELLASGEDPETVALRPSEWFADRRVRVLTGAHVARLERERRALVLADGSALAFARLVLATGSRPLLPPIPGIDLDGVYAFRGPEDCDAIRAAASSPGVRRAVVIGGGLLGLEAARGLVAQRCAVTVVHLMDRVMERQLDAGAAELLLPRLRELGVEVLLERQTDAVIGEDWVRALRFHGGEELEADLVVVSIGIRPEASLAREAGLRCERGIVVDDHMRTSVPEVVAVGECAEHAGVVYGLVAPILEQAKVAAATLLDRPGHPYRGSVPSAKLKVAGIDLVAIGAAEGDSEAISVDAGAGMYRKLVVRDGRAAGAVLLGDVRGSEALLAAIAGAETVIDPLERLAAAAALGPEDLPQEAQICNCNTVCKGELIAAVSEGGCATPREVMARTRAGTGCGSCRSSVIAIVAAATGGLNDEPAYLCPCERQTREELAASIREGGWQSVSEVANACRTGRQCGACKPALAYLVSEVSDNRHQEERHARFINDRVHANIQRDGTFSVVPRIHGGVVTPDQLRRIADAADNKYDVPMVKVTGGQRIDLLGVRKQ
ncbi:MAG TPA: FAD-dependent oxidoreductase, partial [Solirubrobacteraceae bacterium]|nr:FAD-dependent oxidoreductase [Solirubrobacteraceae bacterium]